MDGTSWSWRLAALWRRNRAQEVLYTSTNFFRPVEKSLIKKGKSPIKHSKNSVIKTVIFYCFEKFLIRHSSRKLYDAFSEEAPYFIAQFPMVRKVR